MAISITHKKVSTVPDEADTSLVRPSDWNDTHDATGIAASGANSDITSLSGITGGISTADYVAFDTGYATTLTAGQLGWDGNNTLGLGMAGGNVVQHIGEDQFFYCKASSAITKGQVVMFTGAVGASGVPTGAPATGITDGTYIMGVAAESIALNGFGLIQTFGTLRNVNTSGYADGDILWYNPSVTGGLTSTKPSAPNVKVQIAAVINGGSSGGGTILIRIDPGSTLGGTDSNAQITSPANGNILTYDNSNGYWKNTAIASGTGISVSTATDGTLTITNTSPSSGGTVTSVTGTAPVVSSGGTTPAISISQATASTDGYLSSTDWNTFNNKGSGTVTSVGITAGTGISVSGSPITGSGSITVTNSAPDQTVSLTAGTGISVTGTYPSFTIANTLSGGLTELTTVSIPAGSPSTVDITSLSTSYKAFVIVVRGVVPSTSANLRVALSSDNGSTFSSAQQLSASGLSQSGVATIYNVGATGSALRSWFSVFNNLATTAASSGPTVSGAINALRFSFSNSATFGTNGSIIIYGQ